MPPDADDSPWQTLIDPRWHATVEAFIRAENHEPTFHANGTWSVHAGLVTSVHDLLSEAPSKFIAFWSGGTSLVDGIGEAIGEEGTYHVDVDASFRAVLAWSGHWQAGDTVALHVCATDEDFVRLRDDLAASYREEAEYCDTDELPF